MQIEQLLPGLALTATPVFAGNSTVETGSDTGTQSTSTSIEDLVTARQYPVCHRMKNRVAKLKSILKAANSE